jgi:hypothetical protein
VTSGDYLQGFLRGTRAALYEGGRDSITLSIPQVDAFHIGALIALYERAVGFYGSLVHVNAYHQPGVEAGKKAATRILQLQPRVLAQLSASGATARRLRTRSTPIRKKFTTCCDTWRPTMRRLKPKAMSQRPKNFHGSSSALRFIA